jgi:hypothetical protein
MINDSPTIVKALRHLRTGETGTRADIIKVVAEGQEHIDSALSKLLAHGIITQQEGRYAYNATPEADDFSEKLFAVYYRLFSRDPFAKDRGTRGYSQHGGLPRLR